MCVIRALCVEFSYPEWNFIKFFYALTPSRFSLSTENALIIAQLTTNRAGPPRINTIIKYTYSHYAIPGLFNSN